MSAYPQFTAKAIAPTVNLTNNTVTTLVTAGASGTLVNSIFLTVKTVQTTGGVLRVYVNSGGSDTLIDEIPIGTPPATKGTATSVVAAAFTANKAYNIVLPAAAVLKVGLSDSSGSIDVTAFGGDY